MSFNGSGVFVINSTGQPVVASTLIEASVFNAFTSDVATGLSTCILKDGTQTVTANIPFGGFKLTGIGAATARTDAASIATIQDGTGVYVATVGGTADVITLTPSPAIAAYAAGQTFRWIASGANTTNVTVAISGLSAKAVTKNGTAALVAGDIPSGSMVEATYDGTRFIIGTVGLAFLPITGGTLTGNLLFTDATYDIGASGATRPRDLFLSRNAVIGGTLALTGALTYGGVALTAAVTGTGAMVLATSPTLVTPALGTVASGVLSACTTATQTALDNSTKLASTAYVNAVSQYTLVAEQATTSGTAITFGSIPAGVKRITVMLKGVSSDGTSNYIIQLGDAGGVENTGYIAGCMTDDGNTQGTTGFNITRSTAAARTYSGSITISLERSSTFSWNSAGALSNDQGNVLVSAGTKSLSAELTQVVLTTVGGTENFDAGAVSISYE